MNVVFRVDVSAQMGAGHIVRCLNLAERLQSDGATVIFISRALPAYICAHMGAKGLKAYELGAMNSHKEVTADKEDNGARRARYADWLPVTPETDADQTLAVIRDLGYPVHWLVVDHYALDRVWEDRLRPYVRHLMVIDDLVERTHCCDLLLDQNLHPGGESRYRGMVPDDCLTLLGPRYALLAPQFSEVSALQKTRDGTIRRLLVSYGGADVTGETIKALKAIERLDRNDIAVDVVVGEATPNKDAIQKACAKRPGTSLIVQTPNMARLMSKADLALGAGGSSTWERCCMSLPSIVTTVADNQVPLTTCCAELGALLYAGPHQRVTTDILTQLLSALLYTKHWVQSMSRRCNDLVDGRGAWRVASSMRAVTLTVRHATEADCENVHRWRNAEEVRRCSFDPRPIDYEDHRHWYGLTLADPQRVLLIVEDDTGPVGVVRYDLQEDLATISLYLIPDKIGSGAGVHVLRAANRWLRAARPNINRVRANILAVNQRSLHVFQAEGFSPHATTYFKELT